MNNRCFCVRTGHHLDGQQPRDLPIHPLYGLLEQFCLGITVCFVGSRLPKTVLQSLNAVSDSLDSLHRTVHTLTHQFDHYEVFEHLNGSKFSAWGTKCSREGVTMTKVTVLARAYRFSLAPPSRCPSPPSPALLGLSGRTSTWALP